jgi:hypothetical protein
MMTSKRWAMDRNSRRGHIPGRGVGDPSAADLETLLTTIRSARLDLQYLIQMRTGCFHVCPPLSGLLNNGEQR